MVWEELKEELIFTDMDASSTNDIFEVLGGELVLAGYAKDGYVQALKEREDEFPTGLDVDGFGVAIPHTPPEHVNEVATAIAVLRDPVTFLEMGTDEPVDVSLVFMLCVTDPQAHIAQLQQIVKIIQDKQVLADLQGTTDAHTIVEIIKDKEESL